MYKSFNKIIKLWLCNNKIKHILFINNGNLILHEQYIYTNIFYVTPISIGITFYICLSFIFKYLILIIYFSSMNNLNENNI